MTLGLARADDTGIYLAIETAAIDEGPPRVIHDAMNVLGSTGKLLPFQDNPKILLLVGGGLAHWKDLKRDWLAIPSAKTPSEAADIVLTHLKSHTALGNRAFARICGYEGKQPVCYYVDRGKDDDCPARSGPVLLDRETAAVGEYRSEALRRVDGHLLGGDQPKEAIMKSLNELITFDDGRAPDERCLRAPVVTGTIPPP